MQGFLVIYEKSRKWKRRFIILEDDKLIVYASKRDVEGKVGSKLELIISSLKQRPNDPFGFVLYGQICGKGKREEATLNSILLRADSADVRQRWVAAIESIVDNKIMESIQSDSRRQFAKILTDLLSKQEIESICFVIWKLFGSNLVRMKESNFGSFSPDSAYLILHAREMSPDELEKQSEEKDVGGVNQGKMTRTLYYLIGSQAPPDFAMVSSLKALEIHRGFGSMKGGCKTQREDEGSESEEFLTLFGHSISYVQDLEQEVEKDGEMIQQTSSILQKVVIKKKDPLLFRIIPLSEMHMQEGDKSPKNRMILQRVLLHPFERLPDRCLLLCDQESNTIFSWCGTFADTKAKANALQIGSRLCNECTRNGHVITQIEENESEEFLSLFPEDDDGHSSKDEEDGVEDNVSDPVSILYVVWSEDEVNFFTRYSIKPIQPISKEGGLHFGILAFRSPQFNSISINDIFPLGLTKALKKYRDVHQLPLNNMNLSILDTNLVFILDSWTEMFVWSGERSSRGLKLGGMQLADQLHSSLSRPKWVSKPQRVKEGIEPFLFLSKFNDWASFQSISKVSIPEEFKEMRRTVVKTEGKVDLENRFYKDMVHLFKTMDLEEVDEELAMLCGSESHDGFGELLVWRIGRKNLVAMDEEDFGHMSAHSTYALLFGFDIEIVLDEDESDSSDDDEDDKDEDKEEKVIHDTRFVLYIWSGQRASPMDYIHWMFDLKDKNVPEWEKMVNMKIPEIRITQGKEPMHFRRIFSPGRGHGRYVVHDKYWRKRAILGERVCLYNIRDVGDEIVQTFQVPPRVSSLNSHDVFICVKLFQEDDFEDFDEEEGDRNEAVWFWVGAHSRIAVQEAGATIAMRLLEYFGFPRHFQVSVCEESTMFDPDSQSYSRWEEMREAIIDGTKYQKEDPGGSIARPNLSISTHTAWFQYFCSMETNLLEMGEAHRRPRLLVHKATEGKVDLKSFDPFTQSDLNNCSCAVLDTEFTIFLWKSTNSPPTVVSALQIACVEFAAWVGDEKESFSDDDDDNDDEKLSDNESSSDSDTFYDAKEEGEEDEYSQEFSAFGVFHGERKRKREQEVKVILQGKETIEFSSFFPEWCLEDERDDVFIDPYEERLEIMKEDGTLGEIANLRGRVLDDQEVKQIADQEKELVDDAIESISGDKKWSLPLMSSDPSVRLILRRGMLQTTITKQEGSESKLFESKEFSQPVNRWKQQIQQQKKNNFAKQQSWLSNSQQEEVEVEVVKGRKDSFSKRKESVHGETDDAAHVVIKDEVEYLEEKEDVRVESSEGSEESDDGLRPDWYQDTLDEILLEYDIIEGICDKDGNPIENDPLLSEENGDMVGGYHGGFNKMVDTLSDVKSLLNRWNMEGEKDSLLGDPTEAEDSESWTLDSSTKPDFPWNEDEWNKRVQEMWGPYQPSYFSPSYIEEERIRKRRRDKMFERKTLFSKHEADFHEEGRFKRKNSELEAMRPQWMVETTLKHEIPRFDPWNEDPTVTLRKFVNKMGGSESGGGSVQITEFEELDGWIALDKYVDTIKRKHRKMNLNLQEEEEMEEKEI